MTKVQQEMLLNDPRNIVILTKSHNSSKVAKTAIKAKGELSEGFVKYKGEDIDPKVKEFFKKSQIELREYFVDKIKEFYKINKGAN